MKVMPARVQTPSITKHIILGAGGHARVVMDVMASSGYVVIGFTDSDEKLWGQLYNGVPVLGGDEILAHYHQGEAILVNGIGALCETRKRRLAYENLKKKGHVFASIKASNAYCSINARAASGSQILTRAVMHSGASVGENVVINTGAIVEHDCLIEEHAFVGPAAVLCGGARVGEGAFIGAGAVVLPGIRIGPFAVIGAGAIVNKNVETGVKVAGVPARAI